jgi:hypothetical protein
VTERPYYDVLAPFPGVHKTLRDGEAGVAQLVERSPCKRNVAGSTPVTGSDDAVCDPVAGVPRATMKLLLIIIVVAAIGYAIYMLAARNRRA